VSQSSSGLDGFFRDTCNPPGVPPKQLSREQVHDVASTADRAMIYVEREKRRQFWLDA